MNHSFNIEIAKELGILEAILLNNLYFWIKHNEANEVNYYDGDFWTFNSVKAMTKLFPYATERQIRYALNKLERENIIKVGNYNKSLYDRTLWYALTEKGKSILQNCNLHFTKLSNGSDTIVKPIPYINKNINKDIKERKEEKTFDDIFIDKNVDDKLKETFVEFIKSRKLNGKKMTNRALELSIDKVRKMSDNVNTQIAIVEQSISNGWQGLFPLKETAIDKSIYVPPENDDITWERIFDFWEKTLEFKPRKDKRNVEAVKELLRLDGEEKVEKLIASLGMRSQYQYLSSVIKNISDFRDLLDNRSEVWGFYNKNKSDWANWLEKAREGKKRYDL